MQPHHVTRGWGVTRQTGTQLRLRWQHLMAGYAGQALGAVKAQAQARCTRQVYPKLLDRAAHTHSVDAAVGPSPFAR